MHLDAELIGEVSPRPHVVVAKVPMHIQSPVYQFANAAKESNRSFWDHMPPFKPEIDEVAYQVESVALASYFFNPFEKGALSLPRCFCIRCA